MCKCESVQAVNCQLPVSIRSGTYTEVALKSVCVMRQVAHESVICETKVTLENVNHDVKVAHKSVVSLDFPATTC